MFFNVFLVVSDPARGDDRFTHYLETDFAAKLIWYLTFLKEKKKKNVANPLVAIDEYTRSGNLIFSWSWTPRTTPRSSVTHAPGELS